jgi:hypothetical protein
MTLVYVREYTSHSAIGGKGGSSAFEPGTDQTPLSVGGSSVQSNAFSPNTNLVRIHTDTICSIAFGPNPVATVQSARLAANQTEYFMVMGGHKIAVIANV